MRSPQAMTFECAPMTLSIRVVPDLGMPRMKIGLGEVPEVERAGTAWNLAISSSTRPVLETRSYATPSAWPCSWASLFARS